MKKNGGGDMGGGKNYIFQLNIFTFYKIQNFDPWQGGIQWYLILSLKTYLKKTSKATQWGCGHETFKSK